ncbi:hypothetical protein AVEN_254139-1 [Araneus ventricosus]|uniref:Uncharacterized protein n=1 Tax=Araneus ventricosus TaxID=182803 RepID=A0A4Y2BYW5_ARAVE|nr:hypothetical protein AVEN_254139-1 [Araneus ventricosus]
MQFLKLFSCQLLAVVFLKFSDIIFQLQLYDLVQRHNLVDSRLHSSIGTVSSPSKSHSTALFGESFYQAEVSILLVTPYPRIFDHLETSNDAKVIFPKLSESQTGPFMVS